jgi:hypothetical protein
MQLSASEQHCTMTSCSEPELLTADLEAAGRASKQQKLDSADHNSNPLSEAGVLQRALGYVGPGHWLLISLVSKSWRESYLHVPEQHIIEHDSTFQIEQADFTCTPRMTLLKAAVASAAVLKLACDCGLNLHSSRLQCIAGRWGDIATLSAAFECGMQNNPYICDGAARGGCLTELTWLVFNQRCRMHDTISVPAAAGGSVPTLNFLWQCNIDFTVDTACSAAAAGHQHIIEYLHAEGCRFNNSVYLAAARNGHIHVLQRLRELACAWDCAQLCSRAAVEGLLQVLQWAQQQGAVFTANTMAEAAMCGHTAVCAYLHAQQCPVNATACAAAASCRQAGSLQWLLEHGCPYDARALWTVAAENGDISTLRCLQQQGVAAFPAAMTTLLFTAGVHSHLAAAQWLRAAGAAWPAVLMREDPDGDEEQWEGAVLQWARAAGCTSPLQ